MAHNIETWVYKEPIDKNRIEKDINKYIELEDWEELCGSIEDFELGDYGHDVRWLDNVPILKDEQTAQDYIESHDRGDYDSLAVRFYMPTGNNPSKAGKPHVNKMPQKILNMKERAKELRKKVDEMKAHGYLSSLSSEYISCKACGSRLNRKKLIKQIDAYRRSGYCPDYEMIEECCPVCGHDLRPKTNIDRMENAEHAARKAEKDALSAEIKWRDAQKWGVAWLVKFEYHT